MTVFPLVVTLPLTLLMGLAGALYGSRLRAHGISAGARLHLNQVPLLSALVLALLVLVLPLLWLRNFPTLFWRLPLAAQHYSSPVAWTFTLGVLAFLGGTVLLLSTRPASWQRRVFLCALCAFLAGAELGIRQSPYHRPPALGEARRAGDAVLQTTDATCAPAACANALHFFGEERTEAELAAVLGSTAFGTSPSQVFHGLKRLGYSCRKRMIEDRDVARLHAPALLFVDFGTEKLGHVVTFMGTQGDLAEIWNPLGGKSLMTAEALARTWHGHAFEVRKDGP